MIILTFDFFIRLRNYFDSDSDEEGSEKINNPSKSNEEADEEDTEEDGDDNSDAIENLKQIRALIDHARMLEKMNDIPRAEALYEKALLLV